MKYLIVLLTSMMTLFSCKSQKPVVIDEYTGPKLSFGTGGGFSGATIEHSILPSGEVFVKSNRMKTYNVTKAIDKKLAEQMIQNFTTLGLDKEVIDDPGNLYYFISMEENGEMHKLTWGALNQEPSMAAKKFFMTLQAVVKGSDKPTK
jgi:hypothetical protein